MQSTTDLSSTKRLPWMTTRWVFQRQSAYSGAVAIAGCAHRSVSFTRSVHSPEEVLAGLLQNRSAFSHSVIPDQLSSSVLP